MEKLAEALGVLKELQQDSRRVFSSDDFLQEAVLHQAFAMNPAQVERFGEQWHLSPEQSLFFARREDGRVGAWKRGAFLWSKAMRTSPCGTRTARAWWLTRSSISRELSPYFMEIPNPLEIVFPF
jgi:hypothetical protein